MDISTITPTITQQLTDLFMYIFYNYRVVTHNTIVFLHRPPTDTVLAPTPTSSVNNGNFYLFYVYIYVCITLQSVYLNMYHFAWADQSQCIAIFLILPCIQGNI